MKKIGLMVLYLLLNALLADGVLADRAQPEIYMFLLKGNSPSPPGTVISAGQVWMDRNLGASQVATSSTDSAAYGDLYQWGRPVDGHESRTSSTTTTLSSTDAPGHGKFIVVSSSPYCRDWRSPSNNTLWQGVSGVNNPCPTGFRLPTEAEWDIERTSWPTDNPAGAFASPLKLVQAGFRACDGTLRAAGTNGSYWTSTTPKVDSDSSYHFYFFTLGTGTTGAGSDYTGRAYGVSVWCIKD